jgi:hypothetical protein
MALIVEKISEDHMVTKKRSSKTSSIDPRTYELCQAKLLESGIPPEMATQLGIEFLSQLQTQNLGSFFKPLISLKLNYHGPDGDPLPDWPNAPAFYRIRYLEEPNDFSKIADNKPLRYVQPPNTAPQIYLARNQDWTILADAESPLIITEGELKSIKACHDGFPTIGIGGVHSFRSTKLGMFMLPMLEQIVWLRRNVYIIYDSDYRTNKNVLNALNELADELMLRGAYPHAVSLPEGPDGKKMGLDDYLVTEGPDALAEILHEADPLTLVKPLFTLNDKYCYVENPGLIINKQTFMKHSPTNFTNHLESTTRFEEREFKADGSISRKKVAASNAWLRWPLREQASELCYKPGKEQLFEEGGVLKFNTWPGWGCEPEKGDVSYFLKLVDHLFKGQDPLAKNWFLQWCAYPLQYPGTKMYSSVLIYGIKHGTGKSLIGYTLGKIYGKNFTEIGQGDIHGSFNGWAEGRQFIMGDEITGSNKRQDNDYLKRIITQQSIRINTKFVPTYELTDCINYFFNSNQPDSFFLEDDDRRTFVHEVKVDPLPESFYVEYDLWLASGGARHVFDYLLKYDTGGFNPAGRAFATVDKSRMIADVKSDLGDWVHRLMHDPATVLKVGEISIPGDLFTNKQLLNLYDPIGKTGTTANGLGRELRRAGVIQFADGKLVKGPDGYDRLYIIRNKEKWLKAKMEDAVKHLMSLGKTRIR